MRFDGNFFANVDQQVLKSCCVGIFSADSKTVAAASLRGLLTLITKHAHDDSLSIYDSWL